VSFFTTVNPKLQSSIKLGGWDQSAIMDGENLTMVKTEGVDKWLIAIQGTTVGATVVDMSDISRSLMIEPQLPYMYLPPDDFKKWAQMLSLIYSDVICNTNTKGTCYFNKNCNHVVDHNYNINLSVGPVGEAFEIDVKLRQLMISGNLVGDSSDSCYIPIFKSENTEKDVWYLGNLFMNNYYMVFDQTPADRGEDYLQIGFAKQTLHNLVYE